MTTNEEAAAMRTIDHAHKLRHEAEQMLKRTRIDHNLADSYIGLDFLLRGAWGTENLNALGGGKTQVEKAHTILGELLDRRAELLRPTSEMAPGIDPAWRRAVERMAESGAGEKGNPVVAVALDDALDALREWASRINTVAAYEIVDEFARTFGPEIPAA